MAVLKESESLFPFLWIVYATVGNKEVNNKLGNNIIFKGDDKLFKGYWNALKNIDKCLMIPFNSS